MEVRILNEEKTLFYSKLFLPQVAEELKTNKAMIALILQNNEKAIGALAGEIDGDDFIISSLYVAENYRREGGARLLFDSLKSMIEEVAVNIKIHYLEQKDDGISDFLDVMGFDEELSDTKYYRISLKELEEVSLFQKTCEPCSHVSSLSSIDEEELEWMNVMAEKQNLMLPPGGFFNPDLDKELSIIYRKGNEIMGYLLLEKIKGSELVLSVLWANPQSPAVAAILLRQAKEKIEESYGKDTTILMETVNEKSEALLTKLIPAAEPVNKSWRYCIQGKVGDYYGIR